MRRKPGNGNTAFTATQSSVVKRKQALSLSVHVVERRIHLIRGQKVMLDADLAELYQVPTKRLNEQVKRNRRRFPKDFMFRLSAGELSALRSQIATSNEKRGGRRFLPYVFTQEGVAMLSSVLGSERAIQVNIAIMRAFVRIRELAAGHRQILQKVERLERKYEHHDAELTQIFHTIRQLMPTTVVPPKRRIGFPSARDANNN